MVAHARDQHPHDQAADPFRPGHDAGGAQDDVGEDEQDAEGPGRSGASAPSTGSSLDRLRMRWVGHDLLAEIDISADPVLTLPQAHDIA